MRRPSPTYLTLAATDTVLAAAGRSRLRRVTKPLLMPALMPGHDRPTKDALGLSTAGDVALLGTGSAAFTAGLGCFLVGHLAWIRALRRRPGGGALRRRPALAVPYAIAWCALNAVLWPRTGKDRPAVVAYSTVLAAMALVALDTGDPATAAGGAVFMASDTLLALERFAGLHLPGHEGLVMASYTTAQALLAG